MKRRSLRRSQSLQIGTSKTQKLNSAPVSTEIGAEGRPETAHKPTKLGWKDGRPSEAGTINIDASPDADEFSQQGRGDVSDMPPQPPKLGEAFRFRRPLSSSRGRTYSAGPFDESSLRSHQGLLSQDQNARGTSERMGPSGIATPTSPDNGAQDAPVQFQRMPKPPGWQEQQAVEIRRDWITYLAKGMGIDTEVHKGHELETLVVRRMLEQAEEDLFADSFDELDTEDDEEDGRRYSENRAKQRRRIPGTRRSRSHSRSRQGNTTTPLFTRDSRLTSPPLTGGDGGGGGIEHPRSGKRPRGGALVRHVLRRSQTTGDMDACEKPPGREMTMQQEADNGFEERSENRRGQKSSRRPGGGLPDGRVREASNESRSSSRRSGLSERSGAGSSGRTRESARHRRKSSGGSSAFSVSSRGSSRSQDRSGVAAARKLDEWRDKLASEGAADGEGSRSGAAGAGKNKAEIYRRGGTDSNVLQSQRSGRRSRSHSRSRGGEGGEASGGVRAPSPRPRSHQKPVSLTLTELLQQDDKKVPSAARSASLSRGEGVRCRSDEKERSRERQRGRSEDPQGRSAREGRSRERKHDVDARENRSSRRKSRSRESKERADRGVRGRSVQDMSSTRTDRAGVENSEPVRGSKRSSSKDSRVSGGSRLRTGGGSRDERAPAADSVVGSGPKVKLSVEAAVGEQYARGAIKTPLARSDNRRITGALAEALAAASTESHGGQESTATGNTKAILKSSRTKRFSDASGNGDAAGGGSDSRPPLVSNAARSSAGSTEPRARSGGERDGSAKGSEGERRVRRASSEAKRQRLPKDAAASVVAAEASSRSTSEQRGRNCGPAAVRERARSADRRNPKNSSSGVSSRARPRNRSLSSSSRATGSGSHRGSSRRSVSPRAHSDDEDEETGAELPRAAAAVAATAINTGAAARVPEGTVDDPLNTANGLPECNGPAAARGKDHSVGRGELKDQQQLMKLRPYVAHVPGAQSRSKRPLVAADSSAEVEVEGSQAPRAMREQLNNNAVPPSSAPSSAAIASVTGSIASRAHHGVGERGEMRQRSGSSTRGPGAGAGADGEAEPRRGRSRERRSSGSGGAARAGAADAGAGSGQGPDWPRSVVQSTGAAAAAEAAADDGRYGKDWDKLEMHRAVYASDAPRLRFFIDARPEGLKQVDHHGNTPLLLALKLGRTEMAWLTIRAGAELDVPSDGSFHLLDEAIVLGDEDLLVEVYGRLQRQSWARWRAKIPDLLSLLEDSIPDFYMEMHWSFECSNVLAPLVKAVAPHDHYRIWKRGSWLRMDSTITGYTKRLKTQRGNVSVLFLGNDSPGPGTLIKLDHGKKKIYNVLRRLESPTASEVRRTCRRYLASGQKRSAQQPAALKVDAFVIKSSELDFKPVLDQAGQIKKGAVGPWACDRYECTGDMQLQTFRKGTGDNLLSGLSMKAYFDAKQTLEEKVMNAGVAGGTGGSGSPGPGAFFNFGERSREHQKAKSLAKINTPHKRFDKKIKASMWMSNDVPLTLEHVTPMLEILSMQDKVIYKLKEVLTTKGMREAGFPAKVSLPIYLGVCAAVTFDNCKIYERGELEPELFLVNPSYGSSRRMRKGVFEGVMPGNIVLEASSFGSGGGGSGSGSEGLTLAPTAGVATKTPHRATSGGHGGSAPRRPKLAFDVRQPSFGPGSPEAPIDEIARAVKVRSTPRGGSSSSKASAIERLSFDSRHREAAGNKSVNGGEISRGRKDAMTDGEIVGPVAEDVLRGNRAWTGDGGGRGAGEWEGGDSDEGSSDEEDDDLVLHP